jgi:hypothetical protein
LTDLSYVNLKWLLDKLYKPLICNEFIYGKTPFDASGPTFAYEKGASAACQGPDAMARTAAAGPGLI